MPLSQIIDRSICPICDQPNLCGGEDSSHKIDGRCWCADEIIPREIFKLVPEDKLNKACICKKCLDKFRRGEL
ncbi:MAG: cysteine-rich CWC family protein [SAR324 cluster bacterium]|nr:cysteine-rich CWC family protein [SAR324 cluster bacterium]